MTCVARVFTASLSGLELLLLLQANARVESKTDAEMGVKLTEAISQALIKFHMRKLKGVS